MQISGTLRLGGGGGGVTLAGKESQNIQESIILVTHAVG